jgi:DNA-binding CsgD family transcriptional regulator
MESYARHFAGEIRTAIGDCADLNAIVHLCTYPVFIKSADGQVLLSNRLYDELFLSGRSPAGLEPMTFLDSVIAPISLKTDELIVCGCSYVDFFHLGQNVGGFAAELRTIKQSLIGAGHPELAILGLTSIVKRLPAHTVVRTVELEKSWRVFQELDPRDQECLRMLAVGNSVKEVAEVQKVSRKSIENRRKKVLMALSLNNVLQAGHLLCRFQDNGYGDFGI